MTVVRAEHSSSPGHGKLLMEHQRTRTSWTVLSTPDGQFKMIKVWSSDVLAAEAKKAERASGDTRLILNPPSQTGRLAWIH